MSTPSEKIKVLIVDDERRACVTLINLIIEFMDPGIVIAGIANDTNEARELLAIHAPDAIFLDIEMPGENAFQFLESISPLNFEVIFVTAYDEYALKAFKLNALDYILKPVSITELRTAVQKLREKRRDKKLLSTAMPLNEIADQVYNKVAHQRIVLKFGTEVEVVELVNILFLEAQASYCRFVFSKNNEVKEITMSYPLSEYEDILPTEMFYRVHRSYLVNCRHISKIQSEDSIQLAINNTFFLPVSRRKYMPLLDFLKSHSYHE